MIRRLLNARGTSLRRIITSCVRFCRPLLGGVFLAFFLLGFGFLSFIAGAAVLYFDLPVADYLRKAFVGGVAWSEKQWESLRPPLSREQRPPGKPWIDIPEKTYDGFTLYTTTEGSRARLLDMAGNVVHTWQMPLSEALKDSSPRQDKPEDDRVSWFRCHLDPNGDLLAVYHADNHTPYGVGLAKIDRNSKLLWSYNGNVHHAVDVGDDGTIYTLTQRISNKVPEGIRFLSGPYLADFVVVLAPDGKVLDEIPFLEAFSASPYAGLLSAMEHNILTSPIQEPEPSGTLNQRSGIQGPSSVPGGLSSALSAGKGDLIHLNSIHVLNKTLASRFPLFHAGDILVSSRSLDTIAVLDPRTHAVIWAAQGPWRRQHDATFLANGNLLIYDNLGSLTNTRILEYNPNTQAIPWIYANENSTQFNAMARGVKQRLANGNTLITDPEGARIFEVTQTKELVWECRLAPHEVKPTDELLLSLAINDAKRFSPEQVPFVKASPRPVPRQMTVRK